MYDARATAGVSPSQPATQLCESIAPQKDFARVHQLVDAQASWDQVLEQVAENAPHGFMIYWRLPDTPLMRLAGDDYPFIGYLMGNQGLRT